jgi:hypothetical protein
MRVERFAFDVEVLSLARQLRIDIAEVPVMWSEVSQSTVRTLVDPFSMTRDVLSVRTRREWVNLPALAVTPAVEERRRSSSRAIFELHRALGPNYPITMDSDGQALVLLPLCGPVEVHDIAARLRKLPTKLTVKERSMSFEQLLEVVPFRWVDGEHGGLAMASEGGIDLKLRPPVGGWESVRAERPRRTRQEIPLSA